MIGDDVHHNWEGLCRQVMSQGIQQTINLASAPVYHPQATHLSQHPQLRDPHAELRDPMLNSETTRNTVKHNKAKRVMLSGSDLGLEPHLGFISELGCGSDPGFRSESVIMLC